MDIDINLKVNKASIAIIAWNLCNNAMGRAYLLADALSDRFDVQLVGPVFNRYGLSIWEPLEEITIPVKAFPGSDFPLFFDTLLHVSGQINADLIIVCKPRMPSIYLGFLLKNRLNKPLILDIDDYEPAFFQNKSNKYSLNDLKRPYSRAWTYFANSLISYSDHVLVSNGALQNKFGGTIIPHARDETVFNPGLYKKEKRREELGIPLDAKVVLFLGTPRKHKGLDTLLQALVASNNEKYMLYVIGSFPDDMYKKELQEKGGNHLFLMPNQPFSDIARNVTIADLVCLPQDQGNEISDYQLPAKAIDAIAMGIPVLATVTGPLKPLVEKGLIIPTTQNTLQKDLDWALKNSESLREKQLKKRHIFLSEYSYSSIANKIEKILLTCLDDDHKAQEKEKVISLNAACNKSISEISFKGNREFVKKLLEPIITQAPLDLAALKKHFKEIENKYRIDFQIRRLWKLISWLWGRR